MLAASGVGESSCTELCQLSAQPAAAGVPRGQEELLEAGCGSGTSTPLLEAPGGSLPSKEPGRRERCQLHQRLGCHSQSLSLLASSLASSLAPSGPACSRLPAITAHSMSLQGHGHGSRCSRAPPQLLDLPCQGHPTATLLCQGHPTATLLCHGHHSMPQPASLDVVTLPPGSWHGSHQGHPCQPRAGKGQG